MGADRCTALTCAWSAIRASGDNSGLDAPQEGAAVLPGEELALLGRRRVAQAQAHQEAVELGLRQGKGPDLVVRILGGDDEEGVGAARGSPLRPSPGVPPSPRAGRSGPWGWRG